VQGDMQILWWDHDVLTSADEIFSSNPHCVNIYTCLFHRIEGSTSVSRNSVPKGAGHSLDSD
jgi:hypothetical protein